MMPRSSSSSFNRSNSTRRVLWPQISVMCDRHPTSASHAKLMPRNTRNSRLSSYPSSASFAIPCKEAKGGSAQACRGWLNSGLMDETQDNCTSTMGAEYGMHAPC
eukprot:scaffold69605_cov24-Tisochrysis_lutea.AAC.1